MQYHLSETLVKLYLENSDDLFDYAHYRVYDTEAAADLVQTVFLYACKSIAAIEPDYHRAWLYGIMKKLIHTYRRNQAHRKELPLDLEKITLFPTYEMELPDLGELQFPDGLKSAYREILQMRAVEQMEYDEIAQKLGISAASARQRFSRAVKAFQKLYTREKNL